MNGPIHVFVIIVGTSGPGIRSIQTIAQWDNTFSCVGLINERALRSVGGRSAREGHWSCCKSVLTLISSPTCFLCLNCNCLLFISDISVVRCRHCFFRPAVSDQAEDEAHQLHVLHATVGRETQELCQRPPVHVAAARSPVAIHFSIVSCRLPAILSGSNKQPVIITITLTTVAFNPLHHLTTNGSIIKACERHAKVKWRAWCLTEWLFLTLVSLQCTLVYSSPDPVVHAKRSLFRLFRYFASHCRSYYFFPCAAPLLGWFIFEKRDCDWTTIHI